MAKTQNANRVISLTKPLARAYFFGYLSSTSPRIINVLAALARRKISPSVAIHRLLQIFRQAAELNRFPAFCGILVGGSTLLQLPIKKLIITVVRLFGTRNWKANQIAHQRLARFLAALISASVSFDLLNNRPVSRIVPRSVDLTNPTSESNNGVGPFDELPEMSVSAVQTGMPEPATSLAPALAGRTMDLTLFAVTRALDVLISVMWARTTSPSSHIARAVSQSTTPFLFCASAATIMHAWFYTPSRLPSAYNRWISSAAELDQRLLLALRHARYGTFIYGKDTGMAPLLTSMCKDYGFPDVWGDPAKTVPVPCELVHMGYGKSCEKHALIRFWRGWAFAARMYGPLQLIVLLRGARAKARLQGNAKLIITKDALAKATIDMARSSAFLGAFIALFYYGVCLSRTRLGPKILSPKTISPQMWDSGLCVMAGCALCGASVLVEQERKRLEILFFVLPRAAAAWFPRRYLRENMWKEQAAFAFSSAVVFAAVQEKPSTVRGILGTVLHGVLSQN